MNQSAWMTPPRLRNPDGTERRVGIELEFGNLDARTSAQTVASLFGGEQIKKSEYLYRVEGTEHGDFIIELDLEMVHEGDPENPLRQVLAALGSNILPMEIACPPIGLSQAHAIDGLIEELRKAGAVGTFANPIYALGAQLNPELPSYEADYVTSVLRAYVLLSDWLREEIDVDVTRQLTFFTASFPDAWCDLILDPHYAPTMPELIDDYLTHNDTRYRELDMLPFFAFMDEGRVRRAVPNQKINPRPTYHYRLPNAVIESPSWSLRLEWERWWAVERLAERPDLLKGYGEMWRHEHSNLLSTSWIDTATKLRRAI